MAPSADDNTDGAAAEPATTAPESNSANASNQAPQTVENIQAVDESKAAKDVPIADQVNGEESANGTKEGDGKKEVGDKKEDVVPPPPPPPRTRIGRPNKDDKADIIDQADWQIMVPKKDLERTYVAVIKDGDDKREQIIIYSPYIQKVFRAVIKYFPEVYVEMKSITFSYPSAPLYYYIDQMQDYVDNDKDDGAKKEDWAKFRAEYYDVYIAHFHNKVRESVEEANVRFDNLWAVFKPGEILYTLDDFDEPHLFVIGASTFRGRKYGADDFENFMSRGGAASAGAAERFVVDAWTVIWKASNKVFSREVKTFAVNFFAGTRPVSSLKIYPLKYYKDGDTGAQQALLDELEQRGLTWKALVSQDPVSKHHDGPAREVNHSWGHLKVEDERINLNERVIVDNDGIANYGRDKNLRAVEDMIGVMMERVGGWLAKEQNIKGGGYDDLHGELDHFVPEKPFSKLQAQLCPSTINCFTLTANTWYQVSVKHLKEVDWSMEAFTHLVMNKDQKQMLRNLVEQHRSNKGKMVTDVIRGKGKGLVILLHGPPGVGKTLTAESVAEYTHKPLYSINIGELTAEDKVAQRLQNVFISAARWDAVLLLDEADVILEARSREDFKRNGIVSVFLRMLEYYEGVLFLTTNRLSTMDTAFQSRIHIAIKFSPLNSTTRQAIWEAFINRLEDVESTAKDELTENLEEMCEWKLNGREIRNVLTIAQGLALAKRKNGGGLRFEHVQKVADDTLGFQDIFEKAEEEHKKSLAFPDQRNRKGVGRSQRMLEDY